jgi:hypothetical protein
MSCARSHCSCWTFRTIIIKQWYPTQIKNVTIHKLINTALASRFTSVIWEPQYMNSCKVHLEDAREWNILHIQKCRSFGWQVSTLFDVRLSYNNKQLSMETRKQVTVIHASIHAVSAHEVGLPIICTCAYTRSISSWSRETFRHSAHAHIHTVSAHGAERHSDILHMRIYTQYQLVKQRGLPIICTCAYTHSISSWSRERPSDIPHMRIYTQYQLMEQRDIPLFCTCAYTHSISSWSRETFRNSSCGLFWFPFSNPGPDTLWISTSKLICE